MSERVVLACSGGPAAAAAIGRLTGNAGAEVVAVAVDLGHGGEHPDAVRRRALACGAVAAEVVDARDEFADRYFLAALRANTLPRPSALSRPLIVEHLVRAAARHGATTVAHTGDRGPIEAGVGALAPDLKVVAVDPGAEPELPVQARRVLEPYDPDELVVTFDRGRPVAIDGETVTMRQAVRELNRRSGVARTTTTWAREAPGAVALVTAHRDLEDVTLEPDLARFKRRVERRWAGLVHDGLWFSPLRQALDGFLDHTQRHVSGEVRLVLRGGRAVVTDRRGEDPPPRPHPGHATPRDLPNQIAAK
ncbi:argininosuccinate synthase domain-containing protein [Actinosynnema sp. NPDC059335]|uniref:argininosuccinate synthase domain-containing protein n=1 Tax=Actinosynnema sp. NPDC059335 TaxID=3346804 RepID=UPI003671C915